VVKQPAKSAAVYFDEFVFSGYLNSTSQDLTPELPKIDCLDGAGPRRLMGNYDVAHSDLGFMDTADDAYDDQLWMAMNDSGDHYLGKMFGGNTPPTEGTIAYESIVKNSGQPRSAAVGGAQLLNMDSQGSGGIFRGLVLRSANLVAAGNGTGQNQGATVSGEEYAVVFRVIAVAGGSITLKIQQSTDNGVADLYADVAGLTSGALAAAGVVRVSTTAVTEAWKRVVASGTFTSATVLVTAGSVMGMP